MEREHMTSLRTQLEKAAAFDRNEALAQAAEFSQRVHESSVRTSRTSAIKSAGFNCAKSQHARLTPLLTALIEVAVAADETAHYSDELAKALANVREVVGGV